MKTRIGFVSNSSSSSFIIWNPEHPAVAQMIAEGKILQGQKWVCDEDDNETWRWCSQNGFVWDEFLEQRSFNG